MQFIFIYVCLFSVIVLIGQLFHKLSAPITLLLVIVGMLLSFVPGIPRIDLNPEVVLNIFLPLLIYQISAYSSWKDVKKNFRPIALLSVGHVIFIAALVAVIIHTLIPSLGWPLAFVIGAIVSPPDSVAIVSIAEKVHMPKRILTILQGEGMLNDATALTLFRFALAAFITHHFSTAHAIESFLAVVVGETLYGLALGYVIAELRLRICNSKLHIIASILTPFLAYLPAEALGGSGVLATVMTGFVIGHIYAVRFTSEFRLISNAVWPALTFTIESILFLLVGLDLRSILQSISSMPPQMLLTFGTSVIFTVIIGRFIWVYIFGAYLPRFLFPAIHRKDPTPSWQHLFILSWSGMRGGISLAAALAIPILPGLVAGVNPRDFIIFLVFCVIAATLLLQGLTLSWVLKILGINEYGRREKYDDHLAELFARKQMIKAVLSWLREYKTEAKDNEKLLAEIRLRIQEYNMLKIQLKKNIDDHNNNVTHNEEVELIKEAFLLLQIVEIERKKLLELWHKEKITLAIRNKLMNQLDHRSRHFAD